MNKDEAIKSIKNELRDLSIYAEDVREDWSDFDGRDLLRKVNYFKSAVEKSLAVLRTP